MKTVCAFANGQGGSMLVGIDDDRNLVGVAEQSVDRLRDQLTQMIGSWVEPRPAVSFDVLPIAHHDKVVLELRVELGVGLYGCGRLGEVRVPYVRHYGITEKATVSEISAIDQARARTQPDQNAPSPQLPAPTPAPPAPTESAPVPNSSAPKDSTSLGELPLALRLLATHGLKLCRYSDPQGSRYVKYRQSWVQITRIWCDKST